MILSLFLEIWKEPKKRILIAAFSFCIILALCLSTNRLKPSISDIYEENGYTITWQDRKEITLQIPKNKLTDDIYTEEGQVFDENEVIVYETNTSKVYLYKAMISNESDDLLYFMFDISYNLPKTGDVLTIYSIEEDGDYTDELKIIDGALKDDVLIYHNAISLRGTGPNEKFALYVTKEACQQASGTMEMKIQLAEISYVTGKAENEENVPKEIVATYEKTVSESEHDVYDEYIFNTYYKMSDGTWAADIEDSEGEVTRYEYQYRIVYHDFLPNASVCSNYIVLSNSKNISFKQVWMASGLSSNLDDYFKPEDANIVSMWVGDLESNHPSRDSDTIYHISEDQ